MNLLRNKRNLVWIFPQLYLTYFLARVLILAGVGPSDVCHIWLSTILCWGGGNLFYQGTSHFTAPLKWSPLDESKGELALPRNADYIFCFHVLIFCINLKFRSEVSTKLVVHLIKNWNYFSYFWVLNAYCLLFEHWHRRLMKKYKDSKFNSAPRVLFFPIKS